MIHVSNMQHYVTTCDHFNPTVQTVHEVDEVIDLPEKKQLLGPLRRYAQDGRHDGRHDGHDGHDGLSVP